MIQLQGPPSIREFDDPKLEAIIETMFLAAYADGEFSDEERLHFTSSIQALTDRRLSGATLDQLVARIAADLESSSREVRLASVKERLPGHDARKVALSLTIQVVAADGIIRTSERELILDVADALEIDHDEAADLVARLVPPVSA